MLNVNLPVEWAMSPRFDGLSDIAWRVFTHALMWSMAQGTDGEIPMRFVRALHPGGDQPGAYQELVHAGVWKMTKTGVQMQGWSTDLRQTTADEIELNRAKARERMRQKREKEKTALVGRAPGSDPQGARSIAETPNVPGNVRANVPPDVGIGTGVGTDSGLGPGQASDKAQEVDPWADVPIAKPGAA